MLSMDISKKICAVVSMAERYNVRGDPPTHRKITVATSSGVTSQINIKYCGT